MLSSQKIFVESLVARSNALDKGNADFRFRTHGPTYFFVSSGYRHKTVLVSGEILQKKRRNIFLCQNKTKVSLSEISKTLTPSRKVEHDRM